MAEDASDHPIKALPGKSIISIEHPNRIVDLDAAWLSLGGERDVSQVLNGRNRHPNLAVKVNPHDPLALSLVSQSSDTRHPLISFSVPVKTGRKRRRGTSEPFAYHPSSVSEINGTDASQSRPTKKIRSARALVRRLRACEESCTVTAHGTVVESHRFHGLPDFQTSTEDNQFLGEVKAHFFNADLEESLKFSLEKGNQGPSPTQPVQPPKAFTHWEVPLSYSYRQSYQPPTQRKSVSGQIWNDGGLSNPHSTVPTGPPPNLEPRSRLDAMLRAGIDEMETLLDRRPIVTRRVALNYLPEDFRRLYKRIIPYVGFLVNAGPWRDTLVKFGCDPRTDPKYRIYQTTNFQIDSHESRGAATMVASENSHIFDGKTLHKDGKVWQICDITDSLLANLFDIPNPRSTCDLHLTGWYHNGTWAKGKILMRDKIRMLDQGLRPENGEYALVIATIPDEVQDTASLNITARSPAMFHASSKTTELAAEVRGLIRMGELGRGREKTETTESPTVEEEEDDAIRIIDDV